MSLKGNWPDDSDTVSIEWYDYKGIYHNQTLTEEERSGLTQLIKDITPKKIYITPNHVQENKVIILTILASEVFVIL